MPNNAPEEREPAKLNPKLYFRNSVPYEHEVVAYEDLHPELKDHVDELRDLVHISRFGVGGAASRLAGFPMGVLAFAFGGFFHIGVQGVKHVDRFQRIYRDPKAEANELHEGRKKQLANFTGRMTRFMAYYLPYVSLIPRYKTLKLEKIIQGISKRGESPISRPDAPELLKKFHYGIVDNEGNLVLLKHPEDITSRELKGWKKLKMLFAWHQPFQRTRFDLQTPQLRQRVRKPALALPGLTRQNMRIVLAPVRLRATRQV